MMDRINKKIKDLRRDYDRNKLSEEQCEDNPFDQFGIWMQEALDGGVTEPNAMNLATVDENGNPSSRIVLLRNFDSSGFVFFTNYDSKKGRSLDAGKNAALNFFWEQLQRQIRIEGSCVRIDAEESDEYFNSRPYESQVGALASQQSAVVPSRKTLDARYDELLKQYNGKVVPRPDNWGGYRFIPTYFEFWQGRLSRLHDRIAYELKTDGIWTNNRLYP
jgi:pyridoxamine 5'-phosphate oxidase